MGRPKVKGLWLCGVSGVACEESLGEEHGRSIGIQSEGKSYYKAEPKCKRQYLWESEGRKVVFEVRDSTILAEGSLPVLVMISKQGKTS
jgi:hypothetical protein